MRQRRQELKRSSTWCIERRPVIGISASIGVALIGAGVSSVGQYKAGSAQQKIGFANAASIEKGTELNAGLIESTAADNAAILEFNARMADAQATDAVTRGVESETLQRKGVRSFIGSQRASYAAQGVDLGSGSALEVQQDSAYQGELDALSVRLNAAREAFGYKAEATNTRMQAKATKRAGKLQAEGVRASGRADAESSRMGGNLAMSAGMWGGASTIVGTGSNILMQRYGMHK